MAFVRTRALRFTLTNQPQTGYMWMPNPNPGDRKDTPLNWYWKQYSEDRTYEQGHIRPYFGNPQGFSDKTGGTAWGSYTPMMNTDDPVGWENRTWSDRMRPNFRYDKRPIFTTAKLISHYNEHNFYGDWRRVRRSIYKRFYYTPQSTVEGPHYRGTQRNQTPMHLLASNWKPVTQSEETAQKERLEIAGRNRRYYWKLKYHPINGKYFHALAADSQWIKLARAKHEFTSVWGDDHNNKNNLHSYWKYIIIPYLIMIFMDYCQRNSRENATHRSYVGHIPKIIYTNYGVKNDNWFTYSADQNKMETSLDYLLRGGLNTWLSLLTFESDDKSRARFEQYDMFKRYSHYDQDKEHIYGGKVREDPVRAAYQFTGGYDPLAEHDDFRPMQDRSNQPAPITEEEEE